MFSGIIETLGVIQDISKSGSNKTFTIQSTISPDCYIDQSIAHNGVCLTVIEHDETSFKVVAIKETLDISNLGTMEIGQKLNLERCMLPNTRLDGHMVQGHVDDIAKCLSIEELDGSWYFEFEVDDAHKNLLVSKGSVAINGISLTVVEPINNTFKVAIIPYTFEHTNMHTLEVGSMVNIEFDIIGKYVAKHLAHRNL